MALQPHQHIHISLHYRKQKWPDLVKFPPNIFVLCPPRRFHTKIWHNMRLVPALVCMSQLHRAWLVRLIAVASRKERKWQDRCVNYQSDGGNDAVPAPSVFCSERRGEMEVLQWGRRLQRADFFLSYWVVADWSLPLSPSGGALGIRLPVTLLHVSYCQEPSLTSLVAQPHLGFTGWAVITQHSGSPSSAGPINMRSPPL